MDERRLTAWLIMQGFLQPDQVKEALEEQLRLKRDGTDVKWIIKPAAPEAKVGSKLSRTGQGVAPQIQDDVIAWLPDEPDYILVALDENFDTKDEVRKVNVNNGNNNGRRTECSSPSFWRITICVCSTGKSINSLTSIVHLKLLGE